MVMDVLEGWDRGKIPAVLTSGDKVVGYFSYTPSGTVLCDGDACIIAGSESLLQGYLQKLSTTVGERDLIKKTRFSEIVTGLKRGGAYAFDREAYAKFFELGKKNGMDWLPVEPQEMSPLLDGEMNLVMIRPSVQKLPT